MLRRETQVLIKCLDRLSSSSSRSPLHDSNSSSWFCAFSTWMLSYFFNAVSTLANSFNWDSSSILLECVMLVTNDHLLHFDCDHDLEMKDDNNSNTTRVIAWTSLNLLTTVGISLFLLTWLKLHLSFPSDP